MYTKSSTTISIFIKNIIFSQLHGPNQTISGEINKLKANFSAALVNKLKLSGTLIHVVWTSKSPEGKKTTQKKYILRTRLKTIKNDLTMIALLITQNIFRCGYNFVLYHI